MNQSMERLAARAAGRLAALAAAVELVASIYCTFAGAFHLSVGFIHASSESWIPPLFKPRGSVSSPPGVLLETLRGGANGTRCRVRFCGSWRR